MLRTALLLGLLTAIPGAYAQDASRCLPTSLFPTGAEAPRPKLHLGLAAGTPTLCAPHDDAEQAGYLRCWTLDPGTGALSASAATRLSGRSIGGRSDAAGCVEGYCPQPRPDAEQRPLLAVSTDGARAAVLADRSLHVFDAATKARTIVIPLNDETAAADTNVGNGPIEVLYLGRTLYVLGSDAGPYIGVWAYRDDGTRLGVVKDPRKAGAEEASYSVYYGAANIVDASHVAFADAALRTMQIFDAAGGPPEQRARAVDAAPCTAEHMVGIEIGDIDRLPRRCLAVVEKRFKPYFDVDLMRLASGDFLAALSGPYRGSLALLDGGTLVEKRRLRLARCGDRGR